MEPMIVVSVVLFVLLIVISVMGSKASLETSRQIKSLETELQSSRICLAEAQEKQDQTIALFDELEACAAGPLTPFADAIALWSAPEEDEIWKHLLHKPRPAKKSAEAVKEANRGKRELKKLLAELQNRLGLYEHLAPWLLDSVDTSTRELLTALVVEHTSFDDDKDIEEASEDDALEDQYVRRYLKKEDWIRLPKGVAYQVAVDNYLSPKRKKSPWRIGIDYERYVGWAYEDQGWDVEYHGAVRGKEDLGIDLICKHKQTGRVEIVQCKRLSAVKEMPVRENVVAQIFGAAHVWCQKNETDPSLMTPVIVTSYQLSDEANLFAKVLGVSREENVDPKPYPVIKCNISKGSNEKIYHLPMDQAYDKVKIDRDGECYVSTVAQAEELGFRRAYRWSGNRSGVS